MILIGDAISRLRISLKSLTQDSLLTDRYFYSLLKKYAGPLIRRQDSTNKMLRLDSCIQPLEFVELIEVDRVQAGCRGITSGCTFKRTRDRIPALFEGYYGLILRPPTSLDISEDCILIRPNEWEKISKQKTFKYNKQKYYWYLDGYLYFPNVPWDAVRIEGAFEFDVSEYNCDPERKTCRRVQDTRCGIPEFLLAEIEQAAKQDLGGTLQIPPDKGQDHRHVSST